jgi:hypothetical protein
MRQAQILLNYVLAKIKDISSIIDWDLIEKFRCTASGVESHWKNHRFTYKGFLRVKLRDNLLCYILDRPIIF